MSGINISATEELLKKEIFTHITDNAGATLTLLAGATLIKEDKYKDYKIVFGARKIEGMTYKKHAFLYDENEKVVDPIGMFIGVDFEKIDYLAFIEFNAFEYIAELGGMDGYFAKEFDMQLIEAVSITEFTEEGYTIVD